MAKMKNLKTKAEIINEHIYRCFLTFMDSIEAKKLADALQADVEQDVDETADKEKWNSSDIDIALTRVLLERIVPED